ncbi:uncharacterized protein BT62DRAFT_1080423 [Guyanagaster necrorhizus]|uniref:Uncharacterized protein n=1 Tax=Guyanagaster necrorhizus TaxID=856835 RepID=A0A9P8AMU0_9AGAR|nr:uncharacterized protein BT62DRAFT_1080423 [Guyanagaster necrorhizus MCA 3950]KAG7441066.1 hypothetical protein BT62DRAFT_1080423 [Guyanagaster necrorhizus MCA 3950]
MNHYLAHVQQNLSAIEFSPRLGRHAYMNRTILLPRFREDLVFMVLFCPYSQTATTVDLELFVWNRLFLLSVAYPSDHQSPPRSDPRREIEFTAEFFDEDYHHVLNNCRGAREPLSIDTETNVTKMQRVEYSLLICESPDAKSTFSTTSHLAARIWLSSVYIVRRVLNVVHRSGFFSLRPPLVMPRSILALHGYMCISLRFLTPVWITTLWKRYAQNSTIFSKRFGFLISDLREGAVNIRARLFLLTLNRGSRFIYPQQVLCGPKESVVKIVWGKIWTDVSDFVCGYFDE